jgi:hypothetical protein
MEHVAYGELDVALEEAEVQSHGPLRALRELYQTHPAVKWLARTGMAGLAVLTLAACGATGTGEVGASPSSLPSSPAVSPSLAPTPQTPEPTPTPGPGEIIKQYQPHKFAINNHVYAFIYFTRVPIAFGPNIRDGQRVVNGQGARDVSRNPNATMAGVGIYDPANNQLIRGATVYLELRKRDGSQEEVPLVEAQNVKGGSTDPNSGTYENGFIDLSAATITGVQVRIAYLGTDQTFSICSYSPNSQVDSC